MAEKVTIARPYAKAAFGYAQARGDFARWSQLLQTAAATVSDGRVAKLLSSPLVTPNDLSELIVGVANAGADQDASNFIRTLTENRRLGLLPQIAAVYEELRADVENIADVQVTSAVALDAAQQERLGAALKKRLKRDVRLHCAVDAGLIAGAIVRAGDLVIDGSLKAQVERLASELAR